LDSYSFIEDDKEPTKTDIEKQLLQKLTEDSTFKLNLQYDRKKSLRNSFLLIILSTIIDAAIGVVFYYILQFAGLTNQYVILGIGCGIGAVFGLFIGIILLLALRWDIVDEVGSGYGRGLGTNVFIGAVIGTLAGTGFGSLFGLILKALDATLNFALDFDIELHYSVFGMLIWIVLGLNIGVLVGLITSFGFVKIVVGGAISGAIVGGIGMVAVFGIDVIVLIGIIVGLFVGSFIGVMIKYSIDASMGKIKALKGLSSCFERDKLESSFMGGIDEERKRRRSSSCNGSGFGSCDCGTGDCSGGGGDCEGLAAIFLVALIAIPIIIILVVVSWMSAKVSQKFGQTVQKGALTALGASLSISTIIGSNLALSNSYSFLPLWKMVVIGGALGLTFGLLITIANNLSYKFNTLSITKYGISWKDRHTEGKVSFSNIIEYSIETRQKRLETKETEQILNCILLHGEKKEILVDCWKTPAEFSSTSYVKYIVDYYKQQQVKQELALESSFDEPLYDNSDTISDLMDDSGAMILDEYYIDEQYPDLKIEESEIEEVRELIENKESISVNWISTVTKIPYVKVLAIVAKHLKDYSVNDIGQIKKRH
jgi:hypothetical protein